MDDADQRAAKLEIVTFGRFMVQYGGEVLSSRAQRSVKVWQLFKYFLTNRGKLLPPYTVVDDLWPETDNTAPISALQDLVYRLRKLFSDATSQSGDPLISIEFSQGAYSFTLHSEVWLDVNEFLRLSQKASNLEHEVPSEAVRMYLEAVELYRGDYLPGPYESWILAPRQHYRRILIRNLQRGVELLRSAGDYATIVEVCEGAFLNENEWLLEAEQLHRHFMEALIRTGRTVEAFNHHQSMANMLKRQVGVSPPVSLEQLQRWVDSGEEEGQLDLPSLGRVLSEEERSGGALLCDRDEFRFLCWTEMRRQDRWDEPFMLGLFTVVTDNHSEDSLNSVMAGLKEVLATNLRSGDVITQWNSTQCLSLMPGFNSQGTETFQDRVTAEFSRRFGRYGAALEVQLQPLSSA